MSPEPADPAIAGGRFAPAAASLGIGYERIALDCGGPKAWRRAGELEYCSAEEAALKHYEREGWTGCASEGGLILTLIKAASSPNLQTRHANTFIEALYAQNVAFAEDRFDPAQMIASVEHSSLRQIERNWEVIAASTGSTPAYYPQVRWTHVAGLFEALGASRLAAITRLFAVAPYDLRAGWPDLTLWRGRDVRFVEVKAPGDRLHASQKRLISTILKPLGFAVTLCEILVAPAAAVRPEGEP